MTALRPPCINGHTERFMYYRKYILQITQPSQYRCTQLQYRFAVIFEAPSTLTPLRPHVVVVSCGPIDPELVQNQPRCINASISLSVYLQIIDRNSTKQSHVVHKQRKRRQEDEKMK